MSSEATQFFFFSIWRLLRCQRFFFFDLQFIPREILPHAAFLLASSAFVDAVFADHIRTLIYRAVDQIIQCFTEVALSFDWFLGPSPCSSIRIGHALYAFLHHTRCCCDSGSCNIGRRSHDFLNHARLLRADWRPSFLLLFHFNLSTRIIGRMGIVGSLLKCTESFVIFCLNVSFLHLVVRHRNRFWLLNVNQGFILWATRSVVIAFLAAERSTVRAL